MKGFVVKRTPYGESDLILHILLEDNRFISAFAPGARKSKRRFPHQFDLTALYTWEFARSPQANRLTRVTKAEIQSWRSQISARMDAWARWSLILEWIAVQEEATVSFEELFELREALCEEQLPISFHKFFVLQMKRHGVFPELEICGHCGSKSSETMDFNLGFGHFSHSQCSPGLLVSSETRRFLENGGIGDFSDSEQKRLCTELDAISVPYLTMQLGRSLRSQSFFEQLATSDLSVVSHRETQLS